MPVSQGNAIHEKHIASIGAAMLEAEHDTFQYAGLQRHIGTLVNYSKGTQGVPMIQSLKVFKTFRDSNLLGLDNQSGIAHERPTQQHIQQLGMRLPQFALRQLQGFPDRHARLCQLRRQQFA